VKDIRDVNEVSKVLKATVGAKVSGLEDRLVPLIAQACIDVLPENPYNFNVDTVRVSKILGGGVTDTKLVKGLVLARDVESTLKHVTNAKVVVFADSIDMRKTETKDTVVIENADQLLNYNKSEEKAMEKLIKSVADSGANVIVTGGSIGEMALHFIERYKLMAIKVASKFELRRVCQATNATPLIGLVRREFYFCFCILLFIDFLFVFLPIGCSYCRTIGLL
jgi:T-complex protein 1 subunit theta